MVRCEREYEIVIGTDENAPAGMCFMPVTDAKTVSNRVHLDLTSSAADRDREIDRRVALGRAGSISGRPAPSPGLSLPIGPGRLPVGGDGRAGARSVPGHGSYVICGFCIILWIGIINFPDQKFRQCMSPARLAGNRSNEFARQSLPPHQAN